jgi:hypothetical protein
MTITHENAHRIGEEPKDTTLKTTVDTFKKGIEGIQPVTYPIAAVLLAKGMQVARAAMAIVTATKVPSTLESILMRDEIKMTTSSMQNIIDHLTWHFNNITKQLGDFGGKDPKQTVYPQADDLKKYVIQAFTVMTTQTEVKLLRDRATTELFQEVKRSLWDQAQGAGERIISAAASIPKAIESTFSWMPVIVGVAAAGGVLWLISQSGKGAKGVKGVGGGQKLTGKPALKTS